MSNKTEGVVQDREADLRGHARVLLEKQRLRKVPRLCFFSKPHRALYHGNEAWNAICESNKNYSVTICWWKLSHDDYEYITIFQHKYSFIIFIINFLMIKNNAIIIIIIVFAMKYYD